eukprot:521569-Hanusia_phi.AAC.1
MGRASNLAACRARRPGGAVRPGVICGTNSRDVCLLTDCRAARRLSLTVSVPVAGPAPGSRCRTGTE